MEQKDVSRSVHLDIVQLKLLSHAKLQAEVIVVVKKFMSLLFLMIQKKLSRLEATFILIVLDWHMKQLPLLVVLQLERRKFLNTLCKRH